MLVHCASRYLKQREAPCPEIRLKAHEHWRTDDVTIRAYTDGQRKGINYMLRTHAGIIIVFSVLYI
jgi:hypothetical protein